MPPAALLPLALQPDPQMLVQAEPCLEWWQVAVWLQLDQASRWGAQHQLRALVPP
jgi:hypothetical protein